MRLAIALVAGMIFASSLNAQQSPASVGMSFWMTPSGLPEFWLVEASSEVAEWAYFEREMSAPAAVTIGDAAAQTTVAPLQELEDLLGVENAEWDSASLAVGTLLKTDGTRVLVHGTLLINARFSPDQLSARKDFFVVYGVHETLKGAVAAAEDAVAAMTQIATVTHTASYSEPIVLSDDLDLRSCQICQMRCSEEMRLACNACIDYWNVCMVEVSAATIGCVALCHSSPGCVAVCGGVGLVGTLACARSREICTREAREDYDACRQACGPSSI